MAAQDTHIRFAEDKDNAPAEARFIQGDRVAPPATSDVGNGIKKYYENLHGLLHNACIYAWAAVNVVMIMETSSCMIMKFVLEIQKVWQQRLEFGQK